MHYIGLKDGDRENGKRQKSSYTQYTWPSTRRIQNLKTLAQIETEISVIKKIVREKEK